jgi:hypothetical protein
MVGIPVRCDNVFEWLSVVCWIKSRTTSACSGFFERVSNSGAALNRTKRYCQQPRIHAARQFFDLVS